MPDTSTLVSIPGEINDEKEETADMVREGSNVMMETEQEIITGGRLNNERVAIGEEFIIILKE